MNSPALLLRLRNASVEIEMRVSELALRHSIKGYELERKSE